MFERKFALNGIWIHVPPNYYITRTTTLATHPRALFLFSLPLSTACHTGYVNAIRSAYFKEYLYSTLSKTPADSYYLTVWGIGSGFSAHQPWKVFQKAIAEEQRKNMRSKERISVKHWGHTLLSQILVLKRLTFVSRMLWIILYWNIVIATSFGSGKVICTLCEWFREKTISKFSWVFVFMRPK